VPGRIIERAGKIAEGVLVGASVTYVVAYVVVALLRLRYPYELEWMEGGMAEHVRRILDGRPLYAKPSLEFVSFLYPPLYAGVAAVVSWVVGPGMAPLRLVSFLSSLGVFALLYRIVQQETGSRLAAAAAVGIFAATYDRVGGWLDLARLDSLYLLLLLAAIALLRSATSAVRAAGAGLALGAAFFTKQSALVVAVPLAVAALAAGVRRGVWFTAAAAAAIGGGTVLLERASGGWFGYYCFELPSRHPRLAGAGLSFWTVDLLPLAPAVVLAAWLVGKRVRGRRDGWTVPAAAAGMIASSWSVRTMVGAEVNNLLPAYAAVAMLAACGLGSIERLDGAWAARAAMLVQLAVLVYDPRHHLPTAADRAAGDALVRRIASIPGEVFIPHHGYLARDAGKRAYAHTLAMDNVFLDDEGPARRDLEGELVRALAEKGFGAVLMESDGRYGEAILAGYEPRAPLFDDAGVFWPVTGGRLRPEVLCLPR
jgi:4-amino-4-deoxy-L-arabinose transferase-like glycosyltransferase